MSASNLVTQVTGSMFSGKSSELVRLMRRYEQAHKNCLLLKYCHDTRYSKVCGCAVILNGVAPSGPVATGMFLSAGLRVNT
jgi:thymidine kinase